MIQYSFRIAFIPILSQIYLSEANAYHYYLQFTINIDVKELYQKLFLGSDLLVLVPDLS